MTTKAIFNIDKKVKERVQKKARRQGMTFTAVMNIAAEAYVEDRLKISAFDQMIARAREEVRQGKSLPAEEVYRKLGIKIRR